MKRISFEPPAEHYDNSIESIDEKIYDLINQRKEVALTFLHLLYRQFYLMIYQN